MSNILNHNRSVLNFEMSLGDYWDFQLCIDDTGAYVPEGLTERCLSAYIDLEDAECIWWDKIFSKREYFYEKAVNTNELIFKNFGFTSMDNGYTNYEKDRITNKEFFELFTNTRFSPENDDMRLTLSKVNGNNQLYDYTNDISVWNDKVQAARLNGGWYQGFFCANDGSQYKTLPTDIGDGWNLEFVLNKEDFKNEKDTLNDVYPENKGIFFYIGTRAENKWWGKYLTEHDFPFIDKTAFGGDYVDNNYRKNDSLNDSYVKSMDDKDYADLIELYETAGYFSDDYILTSENSDVPLSEKPFNEDYYTEESKCDSVYADEEYFEKDKVIDENMDLVTKEGHDVYQPNVKQIKTDNKFLFFDRTCDGFKAKDWDENTEVTLEYIKKPDLGNYFTMFHRGCGGYDVHKIEKLLEIRNKEYNVLKDIYRNALAFQIKDDGTIGYKYLVKDCESEVDNYMIESEFTKNKVISDGEWYTINIMVKPINGADKKMQLYFYVNGKLVLVSKKLPILRLRQLDDLYEKQEGVPYNISIGGGTQGLADVIYLNYMKLPEYRLPLEKEFGGSFVGWLKTFRFYTCPLNYIEIVKNHDFSKMI